MNFKKILIFTAIFISLFLFKISSSYASGGMNNYMGNLLTDIQSLSPTSYQGQQEGFFVGGSMEIPSQGENIQPFSVTLPHLSFNGCGGIDLTAGGLSYLNFQYLVQKLQGILQAAPSFAFEIGLKVLSEQAGGVMNDLEAATNAINNLNLNSCKAMNNIVADIGNPTASQMKNVQAKQATANAQSSGGGSWFGGVLTNVEQGVGSAWSNFTKNFTSGTSSSSNQTNPLISFGMPTGGSTPSLLALAVPYVQTSFPNLIPTIRYFVGDVTANPDNSNASDPNQTPVDAQVAYIPACGAWSFKDYSGFAKDMVEGGSLPMAQLGTPPAMFCSNVTVNTFTPLEQTVHTDIEQIYTDMNTNSSGGLSQNDVNLINASPIPILAFLRVAALSNNPDVVHELSTTMAKTISYGIVYQLINQISGIAVEGVDDNKIQLQSGTTTAVPTRKALRELVHQMGVFAQAAGYEYMKHLKTTETIYGDFEQQYSQDEQVVQADLQRDNKMSMFNFEKTVTQGY